MKKHKYPAIVLALLFFVLPKFLFAAGFGTRTALGGRIIAGPSELSEAITCAAAYGPFLMLPFNIGATAGPFFIQNLNNTPREGGYFLGWYQTIADTGTCFNPESGAPIPAYQIQTPYGVSR